VAGTPRSDGSAVEQVRDGGASGAGGAGAGPVPQRGVEPRRTVARASLAVVLQRMAGCRLRSRPRPNGTAAPIGTGAGSSFGAAAPRSASGIVQQVQGQQLGDWCRTRASWRPAGRGPAVQGRLCGVAAGPGQHLVERAAPRAVGLAGKGRPANRGLGQGRTGRWKRSRAMGARPGGALGQAGPVRPSLAPENVRGLCSSP